MLDVVRLSTTHLQQHGSSTPRLDAELLSADALELRRIDLYLQFDRPLRDDETARIRDRVRRRAHGEPVAYITGRREFYGRMFGVTRDVLIPRPDTETLVDAALAVVRELRGARAADASQLRVADVGTGSGCIAVSIAAEAPDADVDATDISADALEVARRNAQAHGVADRVHVREGSWGAALSGEYDVIVSNPPYVTNTELAEADRDVRDNEPALALLGGEDGLDAYRAMLPSLRQHLAPGAHVLLEVDPRRAGSVGELLTGALGPSEIRTVVDLTARVRVLDCLRCV